jgi:hypothetical protein
MPNIIMKLYLFVLLLIFKTSFSWIFEQVFVSYKKVIQQSLNKLQKAGPFQNQSVAGAEQTNPADDLRHAHKICCFVSQMDVLGSALSINGWQA